MPDHYGCIVQNSTSNLLHAQLFQGFASSDPKAMAVAWNTSADSIANGDTATAEWDIQWVIVAGQKDTSFNSAIKAIDCNLGDTAKVSFDASSNHLSVTKTGSGGPDGAITFNVDPNFPVDSYYIGFGVRDPKTGAANASGVTVAFSATSFSFTPYQRYTVNLASQVDTNLYSLATATQFKPFEFTGSQNKWAYAEFDNNGWKDIKYSIKKPAPMVN